MESNHVRYQPSCLFSSSRLAIVETILESELNPLDIRTKVVVNFENCQRIFHTNTGDVTKPPTLGIDFPSNQGHQETVDFVQ